MSDAPPRLTHVVEHLHRGGLERVIIDLVRAQRELGYDFEVVCLFEAGSLADAVPTSAVPPPAREVFERLAMSLSARLASEALPAVARAYNAEVQEALEQLASARTLAEDLHQHIDESQLFRIDHYLGKMGLEEAPSLRFGNTLLEPV